MGCACTEACSRAAGVVLLPSDDPDRVLVEQHAAHCPPCACVLAEAKRFQDAIGGVEGGFTPGSTHFEALAAEVMARCGGLQALHRWRARLTLGGLVVVGAVLVVAVSTHRVPLGMDYAIAALWAVAAAGLSVAAFERGGHTWLAMIGLAVLAAWATSTAPDPTILGAVGCGLGELLTASLPLAGVAWFARRGHGASPAQLAALGAGSAFAGQAALHVACPAHEFSHLLLAHTTPVLLAAGLGLLLARRLAVRQ